MRRALPGSEYYDGLRPPGRSANDGPSPRHHAGHTAGGQPAATAQPWCSLTFTRINSASRRTKQALQAFTIYFDGWIPTS